ncbi:MAG: hypothetical protein ABIJ57_04275 [Pseudomonadota bacterium]
MSTSVAVRKNVSDRLAEILRDLESKAPEETRKLSALVKDIQEKNIAILGEDEAFKLVDSQGEIRAFRSVVHLSATDGTLVQPVPSGPFVISAQGYERWEEAAGAITMKPPHVLVGNEMVQNPHVERDLKNGRILAIHCRTIAFRFTSKGIPQVSDWSTCFDVPAYRLIDLLAKAKKFPQAFRLLPNEIEPDQIDKGTWAHYSFDENTTLWVNTSHDEALQFYAQIINREKKAMDFAQTFSKRNALKHLSGLQRVPGQDAPGGGCKPISTWAVPVISWRPTNGSIVKWDMTRYSNVSRALVSAAGGNTEALMIEASRGSEMIGEDPSVETEMNNLDVHDGDAIKEESPVAEQKPETTEESETSSPDPEPPPPADPEPPREEPPKKQPQESGPLFNAGKAGPMEQVKALEKTANRLYRQACQEAEISKPMSDAAALIVLRKAEEIVKRQGEPKKK